jgi:hypothetical protein
MHYMRWQAHGDPLWRPSTPEDRFWAKVNKNGPDGFHSQTGENLGPCWLWTASTSGKGYGKMGVGGRKGHQVYAHRFSYELLVGPIPPGLELDHLCRVHHCVRPDHLDPVPHQENALRGLRGVLTTHCPAGHAYSPENTYVNGGKRFCRACQRARDAAYRARKANRPALVSS